MTTKRYFVSITWMDRADHVAVERDKNFYEFGIENWENGCMKHKSTFETLGIIVTIHSYVSEYNHTLSRLFMVVGEQENIDKWARLNGFIIIK